ncbi:MAG: nitroreductase family protein [Gemmatimonadaceae bacterium]|nr:nitroreductase family protein [Gemmatimonadaceae bacterium]
MSTSASPQVLTVTQAAETRRSIRKYEPTPIPRADLEEILRVTGLAPSPWNVQPWRFVVVEDAATKAKLQEAAYGQPQVGAAPAVIVLYSDMTDALETIEEVVHPGMKGPAGDKMAADVRGILGGMSAADRDAWGNAEANIALGYLLLSAQAHGYSTSPMLGFMPDAVKSLLGLPADARIPALVAIGIGAEEGFPHHRHPLSRIVRYA